MDWPHDPDGEEGSEGRRKYGHAILAKKVDEEEDFPLTAEEYVEAYGDHPVRIDYDRVVSVEQVFEHVDEGEFADFPEFHKALGRALRDADYWPYRLEHA
jgi:cyclopropane fatty-acyl-phospholipid synthase-like methyltransferase